MSTQEKKKKTTNHTYHTGRAKNFVANTNIHFHKYNTQMHKHAKKRALYVIKLFPSPKAVSADHSLEIAHIEKINIQKRLTKTQTFMRLIIVIRNNNVAS